jgi:hypothetical protein
MNVITEKDVEARFIANFKKETGYNYCTASCPDLFQTKRPDGWYINRLNQLFIIELKINLRDKYKALGQLHEYFDLLGNMETKFQEIFLIFGCLHYTKLTYIIYDSNFKELSFRLKDFVMAPPSRIFEGYDVTSIIEGNTISDILEDLDEKEIDDIFNNIVLNPISSNSLVNTFIQLQHSCGQSNKNNNPNEVLKFCIYRPDKTNDIFKYILLFRFLIEDPKRSPLYNSTVQLQKIYYESPNVLAGICIRYSNYEVERAKDIYTCLN